MRLSKIFTVLFYTSILFLGCKNDQSFIKSMDYNIEDNFFDLTVEFSNEINLDTELTVPVKEYGYISFIPPYRDLGFSLKFSLDLNIIEDKDLTKIERTKKLPNGQRMTRYVNKKVYKITLDRSEHVITSLYLGPDIDDFYLGVSIEIDSIDDRFPKGLTLTQRIRDNKKRSLAALSFFGPSHDDSINDNSGGIFFISNITDLVSYLDDDLENSTQSHRSQQIKADKTLEIEQNGIKIKMSKKQLRKLLKKLHKTLKEEKPIANLSLLENATSN